MMHPPHLHKLLLVVGLALALPALALDTTQPGTSGVIGVDTAQLAPEFWIAQLPAPDAVVLDPAQIAQRNANLMAKDPTLHDLEKLPAQLPRAQVRGWIERLADAPAKPLYDADGRRIAQGILDDVVAARNLEAIPEQVGARYGLVVRRAALRSFPTRLRAYSSPDERDIDRFQESALFPGTPVVVVHTSRDGAWSFVVSTRYAAWIENERIALGSADEVFGYANAADHRLVTGATATTVYTPQHPDLSLLRLDMGTRVPAHRDWPASRPVDGQNAYSSYVIDLPRRRADGSLEIAPALLPRTADSAPQPLPFTRANLLRQAFKFLGERYGWGHDYEARDCSGFVSDVYHSVGIQMPRNTRDQSISPGLDVQRFDATTDRKTRLQAIRTLQAGDLVYIPGHVMLALGTRDGEPYVIHDTTGIRWRAPDGTLARAPLNAVSVTPLMSLQFDADTTYVDRMTSIVRFRPDAAREAD